MKRKAPIILFVYNRPWHTGQTLNALAKNVQAKESDLFIFSDGLKENANVDDIENHKKIHEIIDSFHGCKSTKVFKSNQNKGLANSIIEGVTQVVNEYGKVIVLEDDIVTSPYFLDYMNQGLDLYEDNQNVYSINGYMFPAFDPKEAFSTFLCPWATSSWGWATWKKKWDVFQNNLEYKKIICTNPHLAARFNLADYDYCSMLNNQNSWAIKWYYSVFLKNGIGLWPTKTLVYNIGFDNSGVHTHQFEDETNILYYGNINIEKNEYIDMVAYSKVLDFFTHETIEKKPSFFKRFR